MQRSFCRMLSASSLKPKRVTGHQKEILSVYRQLLRVAKKKSDGTYDAVREQFRNDAQSIKRIEFQRIEHQVRKAKKYIQMLSSSNVKGIS